MNIKEHMKSLDREEFDAVSRVLNWLNDAKNIYETADMVEELNAVVFKRAEDDLHADET